MDSKPNTSTEFIQDNDTPMPHHDLLKYTIERYRKRFDDLMVWINDVEKKASALIAVNGVVLALSATLISNFSSMSQNVVKESIIFLCSDSVLFIICALFCTIYSLITLDWVFIAPSTFLINNFSSIFQYIVDIPVPFLSSGSIFFIICAILYAIQLGLFIGSMLSAYNGYRVSNYIVPEISYLCDECLKDDNQMSNTDLLLRELAELKNSKKVFDEVLNYKAISVKSSQRLFISGCLVLAILLLLFLIAPYF